MIALNYLITHDLSIKHVINIYVNIRKCKVILLSKTKTSYIKLAISGSELGNVWRKLSLGNC